MACAIFKGAVQWRKQSARRCGLQRNGRPKPSGRTCGKSKGCWRHFAAWADIGDENELFQNFKYLWHFVAAYGEAAEAPPEISPFKKHPQVL